MLQTPHKNRRQRKNLLSKARWAGYAAAGAAAVLGVNESTNAEIMYGKLGVTLDGTTGSNPDNYWFDVNQDGNLDLQVTHVHWTFSSGSLVPSNGFAYVYGRQGGLVVGAGSSALRLYQSNVVDGAQPFVAFGALALNDAAGAFRLPGPGYVGFSFEADDGTHYGWLQVYMNGAALNAFSLVDYAYENIAGQGIHVGTVPEPGSLGLLATGAIGLLMWRRARRGKRPAA
jgi:hypothetical protein